MSISSIRHKIPTTPIITSSIIAIKLMLCFDGGESKFQVKEIKKETKEKDQKEDDKKQYVDADTRELLSKSEFKRRKKWKRKKKMMKKTM